LEKFTSYLLQDKKKKDQSVQLIMVNQPGECRVQEILFQELIKKIEAHEEFKR
jgi:3-dehydroquinate synthetase